MKSGRGVRAGDRGRMSNQTPEIIASQYEVLFAIRTGVTVLLPKVAAFDNSDQAPPGFSISKDNPRDVLIKAGTRQLMLKSMKKEHLDAAVALGFIMFYETKNDDIVRSTLCRYQG